MSYKHFVAASMLLLVVATMVRAQEYSVKEDEPRTGTRIRRDVATWSIPVDKTYEELSSEDKTKLRSAYEGLPDSCEPPYPVEGMKPIASDLGKAQKTLTVSGQLFAIAKVDPNGDVQSVSFYKTPGAEMSQVVAYVLVKSKFKPAICDGKPYEMDFPLRVRFDVH